MAIPANVVASITNFINGLAGVAGHANISSDGNKYELYVYSLVYQGLSRRTALTPQGIVGNQFIFKCSPGPINNAFSYFNFTNRGGHVYELRNGIEVVGHLLEHEIDVCVFRTDDTGYGRYPGHTSLRLGLECKFYSDASKLKGETRKYLGAMSDLCRAQQYTRKRRLSGAIHSGFSFFRGFVTNVPSLARTDLQDYLSGYDLYPQFGVLPLAVEEQTLIDRVYRYSWYWR